MAILKDVKKLLAKHGGYFTMDLGRDSHCVVWVNNFSDIKDHPLITRRQAEKLIPLADEKAYSRMPGAYEYHFRLKPWKQHF